MEETLKTQINANKESFHSFAEKKESKTEVRLYPKNSQGNKTSKFDLHLEETEKRENTKLSAGSNKLRIEYLQSISKERNEYRLRLEESELMIKNLKDKNSNLFEINNNLIEENKKISKKMMSLSENLNLMRNEKKAIVNKSKKQQNQISELVNNIDKIDSEKEIERIKTEYEEVLQENVEEISKIKQENMELVEMLESLDKKNEDKDSKIAKQEEEIKEHRNELEHLTKELNEYKYIVDQFDFPNKVNKEWKSLELLNKLKEDYNNRSRKLLGSIEELNVMNYKYNSLLDVSNEKEQKLKSLSFENKNLMESGYSKEKRLQELFKELNGVKAENFMVKKLIGSIQETFVKVLKIFSRYRGDDYLLSQTKTLINKIESTNVNLVNARNVIKNPKLDELLRDKTELLMNGNLLGLSIDEQESYNMMMKLELTEEYMYNQIESTVSKAEEYLKSYLEQLFSKMAEYEIYQREDNKSKMVIDKLRKELEKEQTYKNTTQFLSGLEKPLDVELNNWKNFAETLCQVNGKARVFDEVNKFQKEIVKALNDMHKLYYEQKTLNDEIDNLKCNFLTHINSNQLDIMIEKRNGINKTIKEVKYHYLKAVRNLDNTMNKVKKNLRSTNEIKNPFLDTYTEEIQAPVIEVTDRWNLNEMSFYEHKNDISISKLLE